MLIKIDYRAPLDLCPSLIVLLPLYSHSIILVIFNSLSLCTFTPFSLNSSLCDKQVVDAPDDAGKIIVVYCFDLASHAHPRTIAGTAISQHDLINGSHHHWVKKKLSAWRENDNSANDDIAMTSLMSISDQDREGVKSAAKRTKTKGPRGEQVGFIWAHGEKSHGGAWCNKTTAQ